jgi:hypothetical protein
MAVHEFAMLPQVRSGGRPERDDETSIFNYACAPQVAHQLAHQRREPRSDSDADVFASAFSDAPANPRLMRYRSQWD